MIIFMSGDLTVDEGSDVHLNCSATGSPLPTYQWVRFDTETPTAVSGGNTSLLVLPNVTTEDGGRYACVASNYGGSAQSEPILLVVLPIYGKALSGHR